MAANFYPKHSCLFTEAEKRYFHLWMTLNVVSEGEKASEEVSFWIHALRIQVGLAIMATLAAFCFLLWRWKRALKKQPKEVFHGRFNLHCLIHRFKNFSVAIRERGSHQPARQVWTTSSCCSKASTLPTPGRSGKSGRRDV